MPDFFCISIPEIFCIECCSSVHNPIKKTFFAVSAICTTGSYPTGFTYRGSFSNWIYVSKDVDETFDVAATSCLSIGGTLAMPKTEAEFLVIRLLMSRKWGIELRRLIAKPMVFLLVHGVLLEFTLAQMLKLLFFAAQFLLGMYNSDAGSVSCQDAACDGKIKFLDGTDYTFTPSWTERLDIHMENNSKRCGRLRNTNQWNDQTCTTPYTPMCQIWCP